MDQPTAFLSASTPITATRAGLPGIIKRIAILLAVRRTRNDLARLTDTQLADIGLTRDAVETELQRPVWDVPANWRQ